ncbi:DUF2520 domain-containing protein [Flavobacterium cheongpyeongense]|uniref:DUF2520 domain-containing protein n=1 Tax=Flavobacterium cheongpyeongense TaxID=2212651 RepID=A0A2V4BQE5_9FLAO|nr:Rossmann-like and DUF2520 domain-containing protein [Flavobacterium cheongpyeongense]PXY41256.1 DUF2520 domain-containing protein [Flavobacterium cheongpyeongense]
MIQISIIGSGNVAQHLIKAFTKSEGIEIGQVFSRKKESLVHLIESDKIVTRFSDLKAADLYVISISDNAISEVSEQLPFQNQLVVHTSGTSSIAILSSKNRRGVFYPLQTFSIAKPVDFSTIPICLEAENQTDYSILETVADSISNAVFSISSEQRKAIHISAVFVNNFTNHLYQIGQQICEEHLVPFEILKPLILETAEKIKTLTPVDAQTGPAKRHDSTTIEAHLNYLTDENQRNIYKILTQSIQNNGKTL